MSYIECNLSFHQVLSMNVDVIRKRIESYCFLLYLIEIFNCTGENMYIHTLNMSYCNSSSIHQL